MSSAESWKVGYGGGPFVFSSKGEPAFSMYQSSYNSMSEKAERWQEQADLKREELVEWEEGLTSREEVRRTQPILLGLILDRLRPWIRGSTALRLLQNSWLKKTKS